MQETDIPQGTNNKDKWMEIDKLKHQTNNSCFFLSYYLHLHLEGCPACTAAKSASSST